jgi:hypothetical protein
MGPNARHGPHHGAQKSTNTIPFLTASLKVDWVRAVGAMFNLLLF